jgi:hypothetical protein
MSFKECLATVTSNVFVKLALPHWAMGLTETLRRTERAFDELRVCIPYAELGMIYAYFSALKSVI